MIHLQQNVPLLMMEINDKNRNDNYTTESMSVPTFDEDSSNLSTVSISHSKGEVTSSFSKHNFPHINTDPNQSHKATKLKLLSFARPHMRCFHGSWMFFVAFFIWFSIAPLLPVVQKSWNLTAADIWTYNIFSVAGAVVIRFLIGPLCDKYGAKTMMTRLIALCTIPFVLTGTVNSLIGLCEIRTLISLIGGTFVTGQYWATYIFTKNVAGTTMAVSGGWRVVGSGASNLLMGSIIFPLCKTISNGDEDTAWRMSFIFPAILALFTALYFFQYSDDCPFGNYKDIKKAGLMKERSVLDSFRSGALNLNSWILFLQ